MYLLDTNVVSELRRVRPHGADLAWVQSVADEDLHVSAVTIGEIQAGIETTREQDPNKAAEIEVWLEQVADTYNI
jgi:toxin FitB